MTRPAHDEWVQGNSAGPHEAPVEMLLLHTTEGESIKGACSAYRLNNSWPHLTIDCMFGHDYTRCGHLDLEVAARSLRNLAGGVETNREGVIQIEVVGFAAHPEDIDWWWLGVNVVGPLCREMGIPISSSVPWVAYPASYGLTAPQRLSGAAWTFYRGILGHQHAPENLHGDPGRIPIAALLEAASGDTAPPDSEDLFTMGQYEDIMAAINALGARFGAAIVTCNESGAWYAVEGVWARLIPPGTDVSVDVVTATGHNNLWPGSSGPSPVTREWLQSHIVVGGPDDNVADWLNLSGGAAPSELSFTGTAHVISD
jgi:hypothetical protein